jgi:hypothetical protein
MLGEEMILSKETQEKGTVIVLDLKGLSLSHARQFTLKQIKKFVAAFQVCIGSLKQFSHDNNHP